MALDDPLAIADFMDLLRVGTVEFSAMFSQQMSRTGGGESRYADRAPSLWRARIETVPLTNAAAESVMALINSRAGGLKTVLLHNPRLAFPSSDPDGSIMGATTPALGSITDRLHVAFTGFPAGYVLPVGTYFGIVFDTSRYYLGQICEARTANGGGAVSSVEVFPPLPASIAGTPAVTVKKPAAKFRLVPNSAYPTQVNINFCTIGFEAEQTYSA